MALLLNMLIQTVQGDSPLGREGRIEQEVSPEAEQLYALKYIEDNH